MRRADTPRCLGANERGVPNPTPTPNVCPKTLFSWLGVTHGNTGGNLIRFRSVCNDQGTVPSSSGGGPQRGCWTTHAGMDRDGQSLGDTRHANFYSPLEGATCRLHTFVQTIRTGGETFFMSEVPVLHTRPLCVLLFYLRFNMFWLRARILTFWVLLSINSDKPNLLHCRAAE